MSLSFEPLAVSELPSLAQFLHSSFDSGAGVNSFKLDVLHWKYFSEHPDWKGTRSFVIRQDGTIVAHGGVWPVRLLTPGAERKGIHLIDWAASSLVPGVGVLVLRKIAAMTDALLTVGGSSSTQQILPKLGYRQVANMNSLAKVVRPWRQFRTSPSHNWKAPVRLLRNAAWSWPALAHAPHPWKAAKIDHFDSSIDALMQSAPVDQICCGRSSAMLNHMLQYPAAQCYGGMIFKGDELQGYFVVGHVGGQARILDVWIALKTPEARRIACLLAARTTAENPATCEIQATSCLDAQSTCWQNLGFRPRHSDPVHCYDPRKFLPPELPWNVSLLDGDLGFLNDPAYPYLT